MKNKASPRIFSKKGGEETSESQEVLIAAHSPIKL
jgi:hypothetical protein